MLLFSFLYTIKLFNCKSNVLCILSQYHWGGLDLATAALGVKKQQQKQNTERTPQSRENSVGSDMVHCLEMNLPTFYTRIG